MIPFTTMTINITLMKINKIISFPCFFLFILLQILNNNSRKFYYIFFIILYYYYISMCLVISFFLLWAIYFIEHIAIRNDHTKKLLVTL